MGPIDIGATDKGICLLTFSSQATDKIIDKITPTDQTLKK